MHVRCCGVLCHLLQRQHFTWAKHEVAHQSDDHQKGRNNCIYEVHHSLCFFKYCIVYIYIYWWLNVVFLDKGKQQLHMLYHVLRVAEPKGHTGKFEVPPTLVCVLEGHEMIWNVPSRGISTKNDWFPMISTNAFWGFHSRLCKPGEGVTFCESSMLCIHEN